MALHDIEPKSPVTFAPSDKQAIRELVDRVSNDNAPQVDDFLNRFTDEQHPAWRRYADGIYSHPKTWWIGIIQTQMILGLWGQKRYAQASLRQNILAGILFTALTAAEEYRKPARKTIRLVIDYNLKYRKADIAGRFHGGLFTNYASTGGRAGMRLPLSVKWASKISNFTMASFGAAIQGIAAGLTTLDSLLNAVLTGRAERLPAPYVELSKNVSDADRDKWESLLNDEMLGIEILNSTSAKPVTLHEFCGRPENVNLKGVCK